uniref:DUF4283 domain-containing protein n=1 Tax=Tanacetum cinerariifolium TaxID=118510 RepID=A0A6L2N9U1_TANCI|nr:hypothetical protein [Tanacetum cinerariifolium]
MVFLARVNRLLLSSPWIGPSSSSPRVGPYGLSSCAGSSPSSPEVYHALGMMVLISFKPSGKKVNVRTLFTPEGNGIDVVIPVDSIRAISVRFANTAYGRSSYARVMIELQADVEFKDNIIVAMPKIIREGHYTCNVRVEYEWKPHRCSSCKVFRHIHEECLKNTGADEKKTVKKPSQSSRDVEPTIEVSNSNLFDVVNSVDHDVEFDTNGGTTNLVNNEATSSGSSFINIDNNGEFASNTHIGEKIDKIERKICKGKLRLLDNEGNPLVPTGIVESDSQVKVVFNETANLRISMSGNDGSDKCYGTNSLLEQWRDSYLG